MTPPVFERFRRLEAEIAVERGDFVLFALLMRDDAPDRWDLMVAAPWIGDDRQAAVPYLIDKIKSTLGEGDLTQLARIVVLDPRHSAVVQMLNGLAEVEHGGVDVRDSNIGGLTVKHAYIITSTRPPAPAAA